MTTNAKIALTSMVILFAVGIMSVNYTFAEGATVSTPQGTSVPGCETTNECYIPYEITINVGEEVTWSNDDSAAHTVTGGSAADGPSGVFDSSLFMAGTTYTFKFEEAGTYPYFCMVHPWMEGIVTVQAADGAEPSDGTIIVGAPSEEETTVSGITEDGTIRAEITMTNPAADEIMTLDIKFRDSTGSLKQHANYDMMISQNGQEIHSIAGAHDHEGEGSHTFGPLDSADPVDIKVTIQGFGLPDDQANWEGPTGEVLMFNVVPEFGTIAIIVMFVAIGAVVTLSSKYNTIIPKL